MCKKPVQATAKSVSSVCWHAGLLNDDADLEQITSQAH